jgi:hypothetical protein
MTALRRHRLLTVLFALCSLLFMQLAVAGYSCPGFESRVREIAAMAEAGMPCAQEMAMTIDAAQPNLCHAHCQSAQATGDTPALQVPAALVDHRALFAAPAAVVLVERFRPDPSLLAQATAPPLAIRNCCWRI